MLIPSASNVEITPAMLTVLWGIAHEIDRLRLPSNYGDAKWLEIPTNRLRNPDGRQDNIWLKECLRRLMGVELSGSYHNDEWGAVILAQWEFVEGGAVARLLIPPAAISAIRAPETYSKIEITAAYKLKGHARRLYASLADKKNLKKPFWEYPLGELQTLFDLQGKYPKWYDFSRYVLTPALEEVNDFGTVRVTAKPIKKGRSIVAVRFDWSWKDVREADETNAENERHGSARRKKQVDNSAPPLAVVDTDKAKTNDDRAEYRGWLTLHPKGTFQEFYEQKHGKKVDT